MAGTLAPTPGTRSMLSASCPSLSFLTRPSAPGTMGSQAARVSCRDQSARGGTDGTPGISSPNTQCPSSAPSCEEGRTRTAAPATPSPGSGSWTFTPSSVRHPEVRLGRPRPLPQPAARSPCPTRPCAASRGCGSRGEAAGGPSPERLAGAEPPPHLHLNEGATVEAAGGGRQGAPQAAALGHGGDPRPGPGRCGGRRPAGQGRGDRPGWAPAARASRRRDYLIALSGEERGGGAGRPHPPAGQGRGGGHCSSLRPPLAPRPPPTRAPAPRAGAAWSRGMRKRGTAERGVTGGSGIGWGPLNRRGALHPSLTRSG